MPDSPDLTLYAAIRRPNQYRHDAMEKPAEEEAVLHFLADLAMAGMKEEIQ